MIKNYEEVVAGYKKSLQALKEISEKEYRKFCSLFDCFDKNDLNAFFENLRIDITNTHSVTNSQSVIEFKEKTQNSQKTITLYYGTSLDLKIEVYAVSKNKKDYRKYTLCPLVANIDNFANGAGTVFYKETKIINGEHSKNYYAISKEENGYNLFIQTAKGQISCSKNILKLPSENGFEMVK